MSVRLLQKTGADLRKMQLVDIASELICNEGVDALKHSTLAELAGCTRALVYRYFPKKSDIYIAISESFYDELDQLMSVEDQQKTIGSASQGTEDSLRFFSFLFEAIEHRGLAAIVLNTTPAMNPELETYSSSIKERFQERWLHAFELRNMNAVQAELVMKNCTSVVTNYYASYAMGKIDRETALMQIESLVYAIIENVSKL